MERKKAIVLDPAAQMKLKIRSLEASIKSYQSFCQQHKKLLSFNSKNVPQKKKREYLQINGQCAKKAADIAKELISISDYDKAIHWYGQSLDHKNNKEVRLAYFILLHECELFQEAYELFPKANDIDCIQNPDKFGLNKKGYFCYCMRSGATFLNGVNVPADPKRSRLYFQRAYDLRKRISDEKVTATYRDFNLPFIAESIAQAFEKEKNITASLEWRKEAMKGGCVDAKFNYAVMIYEGDIEGSADEALKLFLEIYNDDNDHNTAKASNYCGIIYEAKGSEENYNKAKEHYSYAYLKGSDLAGTNLALLLHNHFAGRNGKEQAIELLERIANRNHWKAFLALGALKWNSASDDEKDSVKEEAKKHFQKSFDLNHTAEAAHNLGLVYYLGFSDSISCISYLLDAIRINPDHTKSKNYLFDLLSVKVSDATNFNISLLLPLIDAVISRIKQWLPAEDKTLKKIEMLQSSVEQYKEGNVDDYIRKQFPNAVKSLSRQIEITQLSMDAVQKDNELTPKEKIESMLALAMVMPLVSDKAIAIQRIGEMIRLQNKGLMTFPGIAQNFYKLLKDTLENELNIKSCYAVFAGISFSHLHPKTKQLQPIMKKAVAKITSTDVNDIFDWRKPSVPV